MIDQSGDLGPLWTVKRVEPAPGIRVLYWRSGQCVLAEWPDAGLRWLRSADVVCTTSPTAVRGLLDLLPGCTLVVVRGSGGAVAYSRDGRRRRLRGDLDRAALRLYRRLTSA